MSVTLDVRDLLGRPGASRRAHVREPVGGMRTELARVPDDAPVDAELLLESVVEGILASGDLSGTFALTCARCLTPVERPFRVDVRELFAPGVMAEDADGYPIADEQIDLEPMIRDAVVLAMPYSPLCRADCLGLCERCGGNRNVGECACAPEPDRRWAPLAGLVFPEEAPDRSSN
jgi:uncharacterized protein